MEEVFKKFDLVPQDLQVILIMAVVFAFYWKLLGSVVIKRYLNLFEAREKHTVGATEGAQENHAAAARLLEEYERQLVLERTAVLKSLEPQIIAAKAEAAKIIESAEAEARALLESNKNTIAEEKKILLSSLESESESLARQISEQALS